MDKNFNFLINSFKSSIKTWDYFVNWKKVFYNKTELEITLNKLNYLLGKDNLRDEFNTLYSSNPDIIKALPVLLAVRENKLEIFDKVSKKSEFFNFYEDEKDVNKYYGFIENSGLIKLFQKDGIKNLVDYVFGVEIGLDSNGRKNRGGSLMEEIVGSFIDNFCKRKGFEFSSQVTATSIKNKWGLNINVDISERRFDFVIFNPINKKIKIFETNFYNGGGSKLPTICSGYRNLYDELKKQNIDFIWITDGFGWNTTKRPLEETYNHNDYVFNLSMLENDILDKLIW